MLSIKSCFYNALPLFSSAMKFSIVISLLIINISLANSTASVLFSTFNEKFYNRILMIKNKILISFQNKVVLKFILIIIFFLTFKQTNVHCLKFSQKQTTLLSNKINLFIIKHKFKIIRLTISILYLRCINNSFQNINCVRIIKLIK